MKRPLVIAIIVALVIAGLAYFIVAANDDDEPETQDTAQTDTSPTTDADTPTGDNDSEATIPETNSVVIDNRAFGPDSITVKRGTVVTWTNQDDMEHDVTPDSETVDFKKSELLSNGDSYSVTFESIGTYTYHCSPHPDMTGTVVVTE